MQKFGKILKDISSEANLASVLTDTYNELDELKKKRIAKVTDMAA